MSDVRRQPAFPQRPRPERRAASAPHARRGPSGYVLLVVLLLVGLIGMLSATYLRHVMFESRNSSVAPSSIDAAGAVDSGLAWAQQVVLVSAPVDGATVVQGSGSAVVQLEDLGGAHTALRASALDSDGIGATVLAEGVRRRVARASSPEELPHLPDALRTSLSADPPPQQGHHGGCDEPGGAPGNGSYVTKIVYSGTQTVSNTDLGGLVVINDGAKITFDNVTIAGSIVSQRCLAGTAYPAFQAASAPTVIVGGGLRIRPAGFLPGVAVLLPDGVLKTASGTPTSLQLEGDVVAHSVTLAGSGSIEGNVASVELPGVASGIERPGAGRAPREWSASLDLGNGGAFSYLAFLPRPATVQELQAITDFEFP